MIFVAIFFSSRSFHFLIDADLWKKLTLMQFWMKIYFNSFYIDFSSSVALNCIRNTLAVVTEDYKRWFWCPRFLNALYGWLFSRAKVAIKILNSKPFNSLKFHLNSVKTILETRQLLNILHNGTEYKSRSLQTSEKFRKYLKSFPICKPIIWTTQLICFGCLK